MFLLFALIFLLNTVSSSTYASSSLNEALVFSFPKSNKQFKPISLNFKNIDVRQALHILAEFANENMVISDKVKGSMSLHLHELLWDEALQTILRSRALKMQKINNIIYIFTAEEHVNQQKKNLNLNSMQSQILPLYSLILKLNYAKARNIASLLQHDSPGFFSKRGGVEVDVRTNTLLLHDTKHRLNQIKVFVKKLDIPLKQVLIEARIVSVTKDSANDLGFRFGLANYPLNGNKKIPIEYQDRPSNGLQKKLNLDFISSPLLASIPQASMGITLAKLSQHIYLDLELSALESEGKGEIISSPRLITSSNKPALIESGEEIPYQEATLSGATAVSFKKAVLSLKVTPVVTEDKTILMKLHLTQDIPSLRQVHGEPSILTKEIKTEVLAKNGQTIVLGGIYKQDKHKMVNKLPFLGNLPVVGVLFRNQSIRIKNEELLIFITPRIIPGKFSLR